MRAWREAAIPLHRAATPLLVAYLSSTEFREQLAIYCPQLLSYSAEELLERVTDEFEAAELTHNFHYFNAAQEDTTDTTLQWQMAQQSKGFFYSIWEYVFASNATNHDEYLVRAELGLRKFKPFTGSPSHIHASTNAPVGRL
jgi:hypothetical protein